jgi:hypothetical protein
MIRKRMRTIVAKANSCMRAITAFEARGGVEVRMDAIDVARFVIPLKGARYGHYSGLLRTRSDVTKLYLKVLCNKHKRRQGGQHHGSEWRKPQCISAGIGDPLSHM